MAHELPVPHQREWELYHNSFSICSKKVRVCLDELGLDYLGHHVHLIETGRYETVSSEYLAINPRGTVPMLVHDGRRVYESHAQIVYAAERAPGGGGELLPGDPTSRALVDAWIARASIVGSRPVSARHTRESAGSCVAVLTLPLFATMVQYIPRREILKGLRTHPNKERPLLFLILRTFGVASLGWLLPLRSVLGRARRDLHAHLDALGAQLRASGGPYIDGSAFTLADVSWVVLLDRLREADWGAEYLFSARHPDVAGYWRELMRRPSVQRQILATRCAITRAGMRDLRDAKVDSAALRRALHGRSDLRADHGRDERTTEPFLTSPYPASKR